MEIKRVPVSRMLKSEVAEYARKAIAIVDKHIEEESLITPLLKKLEATKPQIEILGIRYGIDPMREVIDNLMSELMLTVTDLKLKARIRGKRKEDEDLKIVNSNIDSYFGKLRKSKNDKEIHQKITGFVIAIDNDEGLAEALSNHNMITEVTNIKLAKVDVDKAWDKRVKLLSERPKIKTKEIVDTVYTAIVNLFKTIEVAHLMNPEEDNTALALELSQLSEMYNRSISIRKQNNQRKNSKDQDDNSTEDGPSSAPMVTAMYTGNDWENDWNENEDDDYEKEEFVSPFEADESHAEELNSNSEDVDGEEGTVAVE